MMTSMHCILLLYNAGADNLLFWPPRTSFHDIQQFKGLLGTALVTVLSCNKSALCSSNHSSVDTQLSSCFGGLLDPY